MERDINPRFSFAAGRRVLRTEPVRERSSVLQLEQRLLLQLQFKVRGEELLGTAERLRYKTV